jgi:hypothetical protein
VLPSTLTLPPPGARAAKQGRRGYQTSVFYSALYVVFWLMASGIFVATESEQGWSFGTAFYFSFVTFTTIGFGDFSISSSAGILMFGVLTLIGLIIFARALSEIASWLQAAVLFLEERVTGAVQGAVQESGGQKDGGDNGRKSKGASVVPTALLGAAQAQVGPVPGS